MDAILYFGGTFDPVHQEHLHICELAYEMLSPDKIMMVPAPDRPYKRAAVSAEHRLRLCQIAAAPYPWIEVSDLEIKENTIYTVDALVSLKNRYKPKKIWLLLGEDQFNGLPTWYEWRRVLQIADILAVRRKGGAGFLRGTYRVEELIRQTPAEIRWIAKNPTEVSSTQIRETLRLHQKPCYLPDGVFEYIQKEGLYSAPEPVAGI